MSSCATGARTTTIMCGGGTARSTKIMRMRVTNTHSIMLSVPVGLICAFGTKIGKPILGPVGSGKNRKTLSRVSSSSLASTKRAISLLNSIEEDRGEEQDQEKKPAPDPVESDLLISVQNLKHAYEGMF